MNQPVKMPEGHKLVLRKDFSDKDTVKVITGREWLDALAAGYGAYTTYDMTMESWFEFSAGTLARLKQAKPSRTTYVRDFCFDSNSLDRLPCTMHPNWDDYVEIAITNGRVKNLPSDWEEIAERSHFAHCGDHTPSIMAVFPYSVIEKLSDMEITILQKDAEDDDGVRIVLTLAAMGDFNGDGIEDLLVRESSYYAQGSGRSYSHILLMRLEPNGALIEQWLGPY